MTVIDPGLDGMESAPPIEPFRRRVQDTLFGGLPEHIARLGWSRDQIAVHQRDRLRELLTIAQARSPFHRLRLGAIDPSTFELADLVSLPVMTKAEMMASFDDVVTDRRISRVAAERAIALTTDDPRPIDGAFTVLTSGGSSGERGLFLFDSHAFATFGATLMRPAMARLHAHGGPPAGGVRIAMVAAASPIHATGAAPRMLDGSPIVFVPMPVTLPLEEIVRRLNELQPPLLYGYPSALARLAREQQEGRLGISPMSVTSTSETLRPDLRAAIAGGFGVPIVDVFGSSEGLVGVSPPDDPVLTFADDCCIVELVDAAGEPAEPGAVADSILVTNLYNHVQPLIRYRIDDRFVQERDAADHGHLRARVEGRRSDVLHFGAIDIHPHAITTRLTHTPAIVDYQVHQRGDGVTIDVIAPTGLDTVAVATDVRDALAGAGLADAQVIVNVVEALPRHPKTGKLSTFVPLPI
jgi:phenylacetate-CoA ligase